MVLDGGKAGQEKSRSLSPVEPITEASYDSSDDSSVLSDTSSNPASDLDTDLTHQSYGESKPVSPIFESWSSESDPEDVLIGKPDDYIEFLCRPCSWRGEDVRKTKVFFSKPEKSEI
jgi:hypothetical protein